MGGGLLGGQRAEPRRYALAAAAALEVLGVVAVVTLAPVSVIGGRGGAHHRDGAPAAVGSGASQRTRRAYLAALEERAARLEPRAGPAGALATATERARIAREVYDIVTHGLSVMVTLADGAAGVSVSSPERAGRLMRQVAVTGRQAIGEMRRTVMAVRTDADVGARYPVPGSGRPG